MTAGSVVRFPVFSSGETTTDTVSPSAYTRNIAAIARETTVIDRTRERFIVIAMSTLLLLISLTLFFILFTLLSEDWRDFFGEEKLNTHVLQIAVDSVALPLSEEMAVSSQTI
ncbi:uncharacterized protein LOC119186023 [Rhipicephalus microplus]|uniref:uncharacterized protein LOC119186023 n=1 Tax=Rhipicephalus microplus TaxID=6941 RepID=UPI003F6D5A41